jgi:TRAP-type C4-dicarboxylate transport system permease small subunit
VKRKVKRAGRQVVTLLMFGMGVNLTADWALILAESDHHPILPFPDWLTSFVAAAMLMWATSRLIEDAIASLRPTPVADDADDKAAQP